MLLDDTPAVYPHDFPPWEYIANQVQRFFIQIGLSVGRTEYGAIDDEEVGIGGWQAHPFVVDRSRHWQLDQLVRHALKRAEGLQLFFHQSQFLVLLILWVVAANIQ